MCNNIETSIVISTSHDPWYNLALEEYLLDNVKDNQMIMYLWQNQNTVVIGSNQNPWKECKCKELESSGGKLARRLSGGGAVFHDLGNLNFTFITTKNTYDLEKQLNVILSAVRNEGINAEFTGRNDLTIDGRKFSGNAFYFRDNKAYHHGTILINADMSKLSKFLNVSKEKIQSKGIDSVKSRVINLKDLKETLTIDSMIENLKVSFNEIYSSNPVVYTVNKDFLPLQELYKKYSSWDHLYGETPIFDISYSNRFTWGNIDLNLSLNNGIITDCKVYSDAMNNTLIENIGSILVNTHYTFEDISNKLKTLITNDENLKIIKDICDWLYSKNI